MAQSNTKPRYLRFNHQWERNYYHHYVDKEHDQDYTKHQEQKRKHDKNVISQEKQKIEKQLQEEHKKELEFIKEQYLGGKKSKKKIEKPSKKFRFSFEWEDTEDTSRNINLIHPKYEVPLLFGRGFRGGIDRNEQRIVALKETTNNCGKFDKCTHLHWSEKKIEEMTERDWRIFQEDCNISYKGSHILRPMRNWNEVALDPKLIKAIEKFGYSKPSPIQMVAIPIGLHRRDIIGIAETGCGKTLAYVLPMLQHISKFCPIIEKLEVEGPLVVVLAPTRELAQQIECETMKFAHLFNIRIVSIVGGQSIQEQGFKLRQGCEVIIATPGRLIDCLERRYVVLNQCHYIVLDEADRMIDMGFEPQVKKILDAMPSSILAPQSKYDEIDTPKMYRTTCMFSTTMSSTVERLAKKYLHNSITIIIGTKGQVTKHITQYIKMVKEGEKLDTLCHILNENEMGDRTTIVFVNAKHTTNTLWIKLNNCGYQVTARHGDKTQEQREESLDGFRTKKFKCLVATDVVARGIDIANISHVINYDMPEKIEMYIHRIGRTARAGKRGIATTFLTLQDYNIFSDLKQVLKQSNSHIPLELARYKSCNDHQAHFH